MSQLTSNVATAATGGPANVHHAVPSPHEQIAAKKLASEMTNFFFFLELLTDATAVKFEADGLPKFHLEAEKPLPPGASPEEKKHHEERQLMRKWLSNEIAGEKKKFENSIGESPLKPEAEKALAAHLILEYIKIAKDCIQSLGIGKGAEPKSTAETKALEHFTALKAHEQKAKDTYAKIKEAHKNFLKPLAIDAKSVKMVEHALHLEIKKLEDALKKSIVTDTKTASSSRDPNARRGSNASDLNTNARRGSNASSTGTAAPPASPKHTEKKSPGTPAAAA